MYLENTTILSKTSNYSYQYLPGSIHKMQALINDKYAFYI